MSEDAVKYADRPRNTDGSPLYQNEHDRAGERRVAEQLESAWDCELHAFGQLAAIDFYATRMGKMHALIEVKCRTHETGRFPDVFLNVRKWLALGLGQNGFGVPAIFVVGFEDQVRFIRWSDIDARNMSIAGCAKRVKSDTDIEPVIHVRIDAMSPL